MMNWIGLFIYREEVFLLIEVDEERAHIRRLATLCVSRQPMDQLPYDAPLIHNLFTKESHEQGAS